MNMTDENVGNFIVTPALRRQFAEDGVALGRQALDRTQLARLKELYEWSLAHPGPLHSDYSEGENVSRIDNYNPEAQRMYQETVAEMPLGAIAQQLWQSEHVWYYAEEIWFKRGTAARTTWHQDTSYLPWDGQHWVNCWISFDPVPKSRCLEVVRASHRGTLYDGTPFPGHPGYDRDDPTIPFWGDRIDPPMPRLPDIERDRAADPSRWDVVSFDIEPGDVLFVHPSCLHGGGATDANLGRRRTLVLRFFGDKAVWRAIPAGDGLFTEDQQEKVGSKLRTPTPGSPFRSRAFRQVL